MSQPHIIHSSGARITESDAAGNSPRRSSPAEHHERRFQADALDGALDVALRTVALPDGLIRRLSTLLHTLPEEAVDQIDWLGC